MLNTLSYVDELKFPFFIILNHDINYESYKLTLSQTNLNFFLGNINKYLLSKNYIKIREKPILGIINSQFITFDLINYIKEYEYENKIGNIFIILISNGNEIKNNSDSTNILVKFPSIDLNLANELNCLNWIYRRNENIIIVKLIYKSI